MSTSWGYVCLSHDPPLASEHWYNHGEDKLLGHLENRAQYAALGDAIWDGEHEQAVYWLMHHPTCNVWLENEYGNRLDPATRQPRQAPERRYEACLRRLLADLEQIVNPLLSSLGVHPMDLSVKDIRETLEA